MNTILKEVKGVGFDRVIAVGGGTVIDISKLFVLKGVEDVTEAFERKIPIVKENKLVILPTTCGTGSEVTNISIAEITSKHTKMGWPTMPLWPTMLCWYRSCSKGCLLSFMPVVRSMRWYMPPSRMFRPNPILIPVCIAGCHRNNHRCVSGDCNERTRISFRKTGGYADGK